MPEIKISCSHCGQHIQCDESFRGMEVSCPTCQKSFFVPTSRFEQKENFRDKPIEKPKTKIPSGDGNRGELRENSFVNWLSSSIGLLIFVFAAVPLWDFFERLFSIAIPSLVTGAISGVTYMVLKKLLSGVFTKREVIYIKGLMFVFALIGFAILVRWENMDDEYRRNIMTSKPDETPICWVQGELESLASLLPWVLCAAIVAIITGIVAHMKGRSVFWFMFSCLFCCPAGLVVALVVPANRKVLDERALRSGISQRCPHCAELIRAEANTCPHCRGAV
jgi:hypothetical protein